MDRVFSADEISDQFWLSPPVNPAEDSAKMNRSASEWAFQQFLREASASESSPSSPSSPSAGDHSEVVEIKDPRQNQSRKNVAEIDANADKAAPVTSLLVGAGPPKLPIDSEEYRAFLKSKLNQACAAVALSRGPFMKAQDSSTSADSGFKVSNASKPGSHGPNEEMENDSSMSNGTPGVSFCSTPKKSGVLVNPAASGSSMELTDDEEAEGETEITGNTNPADTKRIRRMLSNRESARRSRRRKQAHLTELETQVGELTVENSALLKRLSDLSQKYNDAAVDNRVLKADIETLRAKVKMAEETVKQITGFNTVLHSISEVSSLAMSSYAGSPSEISTDAAVPVQDDPNHPFYSPSSTHERSVNNGSEDILSVETELENSPPSEARNKPGRAAALQRVASLEHLQKRIRGGINCCGQEVNREW